MSRIIIANVTAFAQKFMSQFDTSHNFTHVLRVRNTALEIATAEQLTCTQTINRAVVEIAALMHDVNDHKYPQHNKTIKQLMLEFGADDALATLIADIVAHVSYTNEITNGKTKAYKEKMQIIEYQIVQDADRLDAIGYHGINRCIAYTTNKNGTCTGADVFKHFHEKLYMICDMMKTTTGKNLSCSPTAYMYTFLANNINKKNTTL